MKEYAPPAMIVTHYTELIKSHDLILARADILQPHMLTKPEVKPPLHVTLFTRMLRHQACPLVQYVRPVRAKYCP